MQSINEEMNTINAEPGSKVEERDQANNDLRNLFESHGPMRAVPSAPVRRGALRNIPARPRFPPFRPAIDTHDGARRR